MSIVVYMFYLFFFLMLRRPPRSTRTDTLFPYTTLCRSAVNGDQYLLRHAGFRLDPREPGAVCEIGRAAAADARRVDMLAAIRLEIGNGGVGAAAGLVLVELDDAGIGRQARDRKSVV